MAKIYFFDSWPDDSLIDDFVMGLQNSKEFPEGLVRITTYDNGDTPVHLLGTKSGCGRLFAVLYGKQLKFDLEYEEACNEFGACCMHSACCAGRMDDWK